VSSTTYSPALGHSIALGFVADADAMLGRVVDAVYPLKGDIVMVEIVSPHFFDPHGDRLHG
jgi:sarcosine oxidase subunit alpha